VFVFNTDGKGGLDPAAALGAEFDAEDVRDVESYERAMSWLRPHASNYRTVIFDNITMFSAFVEAKLRADPQYKDGRQMWPAYDRAMMQVVHELLALKQHVIIIGHIEPGTNNVPGGFDHILGVAGKAKTKISAIMQDWVWLHVENDGETGRVKREFLLAPQGNWTKAVRSIQNTAKMDANVTAFIELMNKGAIKMKPKEPVQATQNGVPRTNVQVRPNQTRPATTK
jgi:hypothetical protein